VPGAISSLLEYRIVIYKNKRTAHSVAFEFWIYCETNRFFFYGFPPMDEGVFPQPIRAKEIKAPVTISRRVAG